MVIGGRGDGELGSHCLMDTEIFIWGDEKVLTDSGDGCTTLWMHLMPRNCTFKMVKMVNFMLFIFLFFLERGGERVREGREREGRRRMEGEGKRGRGEQGERSKGKGMRGCGG